MWACNKYMIIFSTCKKYEYNFYLIIMKYKNSEQENLVIAEAFMCLPAKVQHGIQNVFFLRASFFLFQFVLINKLHIFLFFEVPPSLTILLLLLIFLSFSSLSSYAVYFILSDWFVDKKIKIKMVLYLKMYGPWCSTSDSG